MFSNETKRLIAAKIQVILRETGDAELPDGEIPFLLHVDGRDWESWANIYNIAPRLNAPLTATVPRELIRNTILSAPEVLW